MALCSLIFRCKFNPSTCLIPKELSQEIFCSLKVRKTYAASLAGVGLVGFDIEVEEENSAYVMSAIRSIEKNHDLALFEFSKREGDKNKESA